MNYPFFNSQFFCFEYHLRIIRVDGYETSQEGEYFLKHLLLR